IKSPHLAHTSPPPVPLFRIEPNRIVRAHPHSPPRVSRFSDDVAAGPNERAEVRRSRYKASVDAEDGRRRREDQMVEIRKNQRDANLQKKRRDGFPAGAASAAGGAPQMGHSSALQQ
uniref:IBB domain-containing protein n=1 Tax=Aegilops tauschii subsp. strangulata TaxID=200361 RepID=A0A452Y1M6_AEGTS